MTDSRPILPTIDPLSYLRTAVPVAVGSFLAFLAAQIPAVAALFAGIDVQFGESWRDIAAALATAAVIFGYYWLARQVGRRWPAAERWLIGSSSQPIYFENTSQIAAASPAKPITLEEDEREAEAPRDPGSVPPWSTAD